MALLRTTEAGAYDITLASGVLYHMTEPLVLLDLIARSANRLCLWTHVYDPVLAPTREDAGLCDAAMPVTFGDFCCEGALRRYPADALAWRGFSGGGEPHAIWLSREGILRFLAERGFRDTAIEFDHLNHPNGPALAIYTKRPDKDPP